VRRKSRSAELDHGAILVHSSNYTSLKEELFTKLNVLKLCPAMMLDLFLREARLDAPPELLVAALSDDRIKVGMCRQEYAQAVRGILDELRPGK
jgi:hypothetical protein